MVKKGLKRLIITGNTYERGDKLGKITNFLKKLRDNVDQKNAMPKIKRSQTARHILQYPRFNLSADFYHEQTPLLEMIYETEATEFAKTKFEYAIQKGTKYVKAKTRNLYDLLNLRPNSLMTINEMLYILAYQRLKFGHSFAYIIRDGYGDIKNIFPLDIEKYRFGHECGFDEDMQFLKLEEIETGKIFAINYNDLIHLRLSPTSVYRREQCDLLGRSQSIVKIFDAHLNEMLKSFAENNTIRFILKKGDIVAEKVGGLDGAMMSTEAKVEEQRDITERIRSANGFLVLDSDESFQQLQSPLTLVDSRKMDNIVKYMYQFYNTSEKVVNGTANAEEMEVYYNRRIMPIISQFLKECNYKLLGKRARTEGHQIRHIRNPLEYTAVNKMGDAVYKMSHIMTINEIRDGMGLSPLENGDILLLNKNFMPFDKDDAYDMKGGGDKGGEENKAPNE